jgi:1-acyl-sn-glycerol-3-phosphate acyltransferase
MRRVFLLLYTFWAAFWFVGLFLLLFPFMYLFLQRGERWKPYAHYCNRLWGRLFFPLVGMPIDVRYDYQPDPNLTYVFCANHFSYLDIAAMGVILPNYYAFMGKSAVKKAPLFGYMFAKLHIQVDRSDPGSRSKALQRSMKALDSGRSIMIFPEGGIRAEHPPKMHHPFQNGAFVMAIQQQVPIVPISLLNTYRLLPDKKKPLLHPGRLRAIVHPPIPTVGMTQDDVNALKERVYHLLDETLMAEMPRRRGRRRTPAKTDFPNP